MGSLPQHLFSLSGMCAHCRKQSAFVCVTKPYSEEIKNQYEQVRGYKSWAVLQCPGCKGFIVGGVERDTEQTHCKYIKHYPAGKPNDDVAPEVPIRIAEDFKEALRCRWVDAYNATAEMCRRSIQSSCLDLGAANSDSIIGQIDWVHAQGKIPLVLKETAHKIRLGGNRGAHSSTSESPITPQEADAIIAFTRYYLENVYIIPAQLANFDFSKSARKTTEPGNMP
jgi:hypothetical protein